MKSILLSIFICASMGCGENGQGPPNPDIDNNTIGTNNLNPDTEKPLIHLKGKTRVKIKVGTPYTDLGASAEDNIDGDISSKIVVVNLVDTAQADTYIITYNVSDFAGNKADEVQRTVIVTLEAPVPSVLQTCEEQYGALSGFEVCTESEISCVFEAATNGTCTDYCAQAGGTCINAWDNPEFGTTSCVKAEVDGCERVRSDEICECSLNEPKAPIEPGDQNTDFTVSQTSGKAPFLVKFTDTSKGNDIFRWEWDLGDGTKSALQNTERLYYQPGNYTITLKVTDRDGSTLKTKEALISVTDPAIPPIYIDPENSDDGSQNGSLQHPFSSWKNVTFAPGNMYLQKRGSVAYEQIRVETSGTERSPIVIGAYGSGAKPVLDGKNSGDIIGLRIGKYQKGDPVGYIHTNDFEIRNFQQTAVTTHSHKIKAPHHCSFTNLYLHHSGPSPQYGSHMPGMYLWPTRENLTDPLYNRITNCRSENNKEHGFKIASGSSIIDHCSAQNNRAHGISIPFEGHHIQVVGAKVSSNGASGVELGGGDNSARDIDSTQNRFGMIINELDNKEVRDLRAYDNSRYGIYMSCRESMPPINHVLISESLIYDNQEFGIRFDGGCQNTTIQYSAIYGNKERGISSEKKPTGINIYYNLIYDNTLGISLSNSKSVKIINNSFYNSNIILSSSIEAEVKNNILGQIMGKYTDDANFSGEGCFVDAGARNFHLKNGSNCINGGTETGLNLLRDYERNPIVGKPDIGAYEATE